MDIKCPSSGECEKVNWENIARLNEHDEVKFVIGDRADYDWACDMIRKHGLSQRCAVLISTVFGKIDPKDVSQWMIEDKLDARFQLQMHKYIWNPETRGV
jgi:7-carboxy-7-deazaguanine synthase